MLPVTRLLLVACLAVACSERSTKTARTSTTPELGAYRASITDATVASPDATSIPDASTYATLADALAALRARELAEAADHIARRAAQPASKMRLAPGEAHAAAIALLAIAHREPIRALHGMMPRSTIELARAVAERGVSLDEADAIATYLVGFVAALRFERLHVFDENHSHVIGRDWSEIDYRGEGMTWESQRDYWRPKGVTSFQRAGFIHAYFMGAEHLEHWKRVYRPRGKVSDAPAPADRPRDP